jgi:hypothetical protein
MDRHPSTGEDLYLADGRMVKYLARNLVEVLLCKMPNGEVRAMTRGELFTKEEAVARKLSEQEVNNNPSMGNTR